MKQIIISLVLSTFSIVAQAQENTGSWRVEPMMIKLHSDYHFWVLNQWSAPNVNFYVGATVTQAESDMASGKSALTVLNRPMSPQMLAMAADNGIVPVGKIFAKSAVTVIVNQEGGISSLWLSKSKWSRGLTVLELRKIFSCEIKRWDEIGGLGKTGPIEVVVPSSITAANERIKSSLNLSKIGDCARILDGEMSAEDAVAASRNAIGVSTIPNAEKILIVKVAVSAGATPSTYSLTDIRSGLYPLAQSWYVYMATGARKASAVEQGIYEAMTDKANPLFIHAHMYIIESDLITLK